MTGDAVAGATARLVLEPLCATHAAALFPLLSDERMYAFVPDAPPASVDALRARYARLESRLSADGSERWWNWALRRRAPDEYVGYVQATIERDGTAWIAYMIGVPYWGQGFASEAVRRLCEGLFADPRILRLQATVDTRNVASMRVLDRLGFTRSAAPRPAAEPIGGAACAEWEYVLARL